MKTIIYYRKSTDRDDKQANSLEHQLKNCRDTVERFGLSVFRELGESKSAKIEFTREKFNELIALCKKGNIDYIVADEPKRLSRNNIDTSRIIDLMDKGHIKGIITSNREYYTEHSRDKFFLQFDLALSKMDNEDRAKDIKDKMITCIKKGRWVGVAPAGYKNVTITKGHKEIHVDKKTSVHIRKMFRLRCEGYSPVLISEILFKDGFVNTKGNAINHQQIRHKLANKFYIGIMNWGGKEYPGNHPLLITKETFYKANSIRPKGRYIKREFKYDLAGILTDIDGIPLRASTTKGHVYYAHGAKSKHKINISEKKVLEQAHTIFKNAEFPEGVKKISLEMIEKMYQNIQSTGKSNQEELQTSKTKLEKRKETLMDMYLDGEIEKALYKEKLAEIEIDMSIIEEKMTKKVVFSSEKMKIIQNKIELFFSAYKRKNELSIPKRLEILKSLRIELFVNTKKELQLAESRLVKTLQNINNHIWYTR